MRSVVHVLTAFLLLCFPCLVGAGIYNSAEPANLPGETAQIVAKLSELRGYGPPDGVTMKDTTRQRDEYLAKADALRKKPNPTIDDRANLGAYLIRLYGPKPGAPDYWNEAARVLAAANKESPQHFAVLANLGTVHHLLATLGPSAHPIGGEVGLRMAERYLDQAVSLAPDVASKEAERFHLRLVQLRAEELRQPASGFPTTPQPDPLFRVKFIGDNGRWAVGTLAAQQRAGLPADALASVERLLLTLPNDDKLSWLLAELANVQGDLAGLKVAASLYPESGPELRRRKTLLRDAIAWRETLGRSSQPSAAALQIILDAVASPAGGPDAGVLATEQLASVPPPPGLPDFTDLESQDELDAEVAAPTLAFAALGWRAWVVASGGALVVAALLWLQLREVLRKRQLRHAGEGR